MKSSYIFLLAFALLSCENKSKPQKPGFLLGTWKRINDKSGKQTYEVWKTNFTGLGYTMQEKDTIFKEVLSIVSIKDTLFYKVVGVNPKPTLFKFTSQTETSFVCENLQNEFPKKITYRLENDTLKARVSNPDFKIDFVFVRKG